MRTFHTGGVAGKYLTGVANVKQKRQSNLRELHEDIRRGHVTFEEEGGSERERVRSVQAVLKVLEDQVGGLLRVVELFEARKPKGQAIITEHGGKVLDIEMKGLRHVILSSPIPMDETPSHFVGETATEDIHGGDGEVLVNAGEQITEKHFRKMKEAKPKEVYLRKAVLVPYRGELQVKAGDIVQPGDRLTEGPLDPQKVLELQGPRGVQDYLVREIQSVYKGQGVDINDKHVEVIVRQMLKKRRVGHPGDTLFLPGQIVDKFALDDENTRAREKGGAEATAVWVLLGITEASLATDSFLSAASFQKTTRVLTEAAVRGKKDELVGLKENVIIGRLIPAGTGLPRYRVMEPGTPEGEPIVVEPPARDERILPMGPSDGDTPEIGSAFGDNPDHPLAEAEMDENPLEEDILGLGDVDTDLADLLPDVLLGLGDAESLGEEEILPAELEDPTAEEGAGEDKPAEE
jgi:DNA-directed RNA polymerase subunit beta'